MEEEHGDIEPIIVKRLAPNENLVEEMKRHGIACESIPIGSHPLESKPYYSHLFPFTPKLVTNRGLVKLRGRNVSFVQIIQRN